MFVRSFDYRPFVINWCLELRLLDGRVASQKESLKAEWLFSQGKGRHFKPGEHVELVEYLCQTCPVVSDPSTDDEDEKLSRILHKQRQHKEEFLNKMSQSMHVESLKDCQQHDSNPMAQSYHFKTDSSVKGSEADVTLPPNVVPSKIMYESAPDVLFHSSPPDSSQNAPPSFQPGKYPRSVSKSELLRSSIKSPITIEQVPMEGVETSPKPKAAHSSPEGAKSPYQHYEDRRVRPSSASEIKQTHTPKGTLVRKVSKRATSPCTPLSGPGRSKLPHSTSSKSRISPSRSCILSAARLSAAAGKNSSESDTSEELSHSNRTPQRSFRSLSGDSHSRTNSPILHQQYAPAALSPTKRVFGLKVDEDDSVGESGHRSRSFQARITKSKTMSEIYGKSEEDIARAATRIQSVWRGYFVRHHNPRVSKMLQEVRFRRLEDHIQHLHGHLCRLTDFVLRQQQDLHHERELRKRQSEDIRHLHEKARDLQKCMTVALNKAKTNVFPNNPDLDPSNKDSPREGSLPDSKLEKMLPGQSSESLNLALRYSTQAYQENSGLYSPSSQTSSVTSSAPDTTFSRSKSRRELQPSASDASDADSGLQSMISPNVGTAAAEVDHPLTNGFGSDPGSSFRRSGDGFHRSAKQISLPSEREVDCDDLLRSKISMYPGRIPAALRNSAPLASIPSSGEEAWTMQNRHDAGYMASGKPVLQAQKVGYIEYSNSSVENSPCSAFTPDDYDPLSRPWLEPHPLPRFQAPTNLATKREETIKAKAAEAIVSSASTVTKEHPRLDTLPGYCNKPCTSTFSRDKMAQHYPRGFKPCPQCNFKVAGKACDHQDACTYKSCSVLSKSKVSTPLDDIDSPQSPCTVEMSGRISHSCSFQSDGFTAAEELSATATVKVFSTRNLTMTCTNGTLSPQTGSQRPVTMTDASPQSNLRSPLVLAANVWDKKVQDIESTFHQLQTQIRDLEGTFGQIGQLGQIFCPGILQDDSKESRPALQGGDSSSNPLALEMPSFNFKHTDSTNNDVVFHSRFAGNLPFLPNASGPQHQPAPQSRSDCRVEEVDSETWPVSESGRGVPKNSAGDHQGADSEKCG